jgi:hypothetical protein
MNCNEFARKAEGFTLAELSQTADAELLTHGRGCATCADWLQQRHALAGAMQVLRSSTAVMEAPIDVEREVLRKFRQSAAFVPPSELPHQSAFRWSGLIKWGSYAAVAAALAICLGLGLWFWPHSEKRATASAQPAATVEQPAASAAAQPDKVAQLPEVKTTAATAVVPHHAASAGATAQAKAAAATGSYAQTAQAQGYTPLMLCDPLSCSGDEQVVRLELPATTTDGSAGSQMADVIVGDDGLVRAIRIVQQ